MIDVSDAEGSDSDDGHGYFRSSPWASSDILMMLMYDLTPASGLDRQFYQGSLTTGDTVKRIWLSGPKTSGD